MPSREALIAVADCIDRIGVEQLLRALGKLIGEGLESSIKTTGALVAEPPPLSLPEIARRFNRDSLRRSEIIGHHIEDTSWNMMLIAFADAAQGVATSVSAACNASGSPRTSALRHIARLEQDGLLSRRSDPSDGRRTFLRPTPSAMERMERMVMSFCVPPPERH